MPEHDPTRTDRLALYMRARAADKAARDEAARVIERWNIALSVGRGALWSPTIRCAVIAGMPWLDVHCPGCQTSPRDRYPDNRPSFARVSGEPRARAAILLVPGGGADASDYRIARQPPGRSVDRRHWMTSLIKRLSCSRSFCPAFGM